jgi:electron transfer flavoprotein beta subunit
MKLSGNIATVVREVDAGLETVEVDLPAVITVDLRLNEPRFVKLPDIMKAKRKPLDVISIDELGVTAENDLQLTHFAPPPVREKGIMVEDTAQLVAALKSRGLV